MENYRVNLRTKLQLYLNWTCLYSPENTHRWGKYHCMACLQFYKFGFSCFTTYLQKKFSLPWSSPVLLNWKPAVQWSFPQRWVFSGFTSCSLSTYKLTAYFLACFKPTQSNHRPSIKWYFPLWSKWLFTGQHVIKNGKNWFVYHDQFIGSPFSFFAEK